MSNAQSMRRVADRHSRRRLNFHGIPHAHRHVPCIFRETHLRDLNLTLKRKSRSTTPPSGTTSAECSVRGRSGLVYAEKGADVVEQALADALDTGQLVHRAIRAAFHNAARKRGPNA